MSDDYQLRKDTDKLMDKVEDMNRVLVPFEDGSELQGVFFKEDMSDAGTLDAILKNYGVIGEDGSADIDLSKYVTETELNTILSSYVTSGTLSGYALKSELFSGSYVDLTNVPSTFPPSSHTHDDRYYTESEIDTALSNKSDSTHSHGNISNGGRINGAKDGAILHIADENGTIGATLYLNANKVKDSNAHSNIGTSSLDGQDAINTAIDTALGGKAPSSHNHDTRYYLQSDLDLLFDAKADYVHTHDDRYYTETEIDEMNCGTFAELQSLITNASSGDTIILDKDYKNTGSESEITIGKVLTIIGNGHIIDADGKSRIFNIPSYGSNANEYIYIDEVVFKNGYANGGGAVWLRGTCIFNNCVFTNNIGIVQGGAVECDSNGSFINCRFLHNSATEDHGGAVFCASSNVKFVGCSFMKNSAVGGGGAIYCYTPNNLISNCDFEYNTAYYGSDVYVIAYPPIAIYNCRVLNSQGLDGAVNKNYLSEENLVTAWSGTVSDTNIPSEKLVKDSLDALDSSVGSFGDLQTLIDNASSGDTIVLTTNYLNSGNESAITINKPLTIIGNNHIIDANGHSGIFYINSNGDGCKIIGLTFLNGNVSQREGGAIACQNNNIIADCVFSNNHTDIWGGAVYMDSSNTISNCIFNNNSATNVDNIANDQFTGTLIIYNCHVTTGLAYTVNKDDLNSNNLVTSWSGTVSDTNIPSEKLVKDSIDAITGITVDSSMSTTSTNPLQNKVITNVVRYEITSSNYNPAIDSTVTITVKALNQLGNTVSSHSLTLTLPDGTTTSITTNSSGVATYTYTCSSWGVCRFGVGSSDCFINVNGWKQVGTKTVSGVTYTAKVDGNGMGVMEVSCSNVSLASGSSHSTNLNFVTDGYRPKSSPISLNQRSVANNIIVYLWASEIGLTNTYSSSQTVSFTMRIPYFYY